MTTRNQIKISDLLNNSAENIQETQAYFYNLCNERAIEQEQALLKQQEEQLKLARQQEEERLRKEQYWREKKEIDKQNKMKMNSLCTTFFNYDNRLIPKNEIVEQQKKLIAMTEEEIKHRQQMNQFMGRHRYK